MTSATKTCKHKFIFLRQDNRPADSSYRPERQRIGVFFCENCLEYKEVIAAETRTYGSGVQEWGYRTCSK